VGGKADTDDGLGNSEVDMASPLDLQKLLDHPFGGFDCFALKTRACICN